MLTECAEHLAREYHETRSRVGDQQDVLAAYSWSSLPASERELEVAVMLSLLHDCAVICPDSTYRIGISPLATTGRPSNYARNTKPCPRCGVWACGQCGWKRFSANLAQPRQVCARCRGPLGTMRPTRHSRRTWLVCNDIPPEKRAEAWASAPDD
jgi:hypothetical protein